MDDKIGLVSASISAYEKGAKYPSVEVLIKLCDFFNVSSDYLLGLSDNNELKKANLTDEQTELVLGIVRQFELSNK